MFLIKEKHRRVDLSSINFLSLKGAEILNLDDGENEGSKVEDDQKVTMDDLFGTEDDPITENLVDPTADVFALHPLVTESVSTQLVPNKSVIVASELVPNVTDHAPYPIDV